MSKVSKNIRPPCGQSIASQIQTIWLGDCGQSLNAGTKPTVFTLQNVTQVKNYLGAGYFDPYPVAEQNLAPDCSPYNAGGCPDNPCYHCGDFGVTNNNIPCWPLDPADYQPCVTGSGHVTIQNGDYFNCFQTSSITKSVSSCQKHVGRKMIYSAKAWHGRYSYLYNPLYPSYTDWCCGPTCNFIPFAPNPPTPTKYLALSATTGFTKNTTIYDLSSSIHGEICCFDPDPGVIPPDCHETPEHFLCCPNFCTTATVLDTINITANATNNVHLDKFGNSYVDSCVSSSSGGPGDEEHFFADQVFNDLPAASTDVGTLLSVFCGRLFVGFNPDSISVSGGNIELIYNTTLVCTDECGVPTSTTTYFLLKLILSLGGHTLDIYSQGLKLPKTFCDSDGYCPSIVQTEAIHYVYSDTGFSFVSDLTGVGSISFDQTQHQEINGSLSSPYTQQNVKDDITTLLSNYPLDDDIKLPWQLRYVGGPLLTYDEAPGAQIPVVTNCIPNVVYSGQIKGKPAPDGVDKFWDAYHLNYGICDSLVQPGCLTFYVRDHGAHSTSGDINAPCATQWLNVFEQSNVPQGAFVFMNQMFTVPGQCNSNGATQIFDDTVWACKYAEILIPKQSFNFARPCGADRFMPTGSGYCVTNFASNVITCDPSISITDILPNDYIWLCGISGSVDGCYKVNFVAGASDIHVQHMVATASALPGLPIIADCGTGIVSRLTWPEILQPAICGRMDITAATTGSPVTVSLAEPSYLVNGDSVEILNAVGGNINGIWPIKVLDNQNIILVGSTGVGTSPYTGSGQIQSPFAVSWDWNDVTSKGNFTFYSWDWDFRSVMEYQRMAFQSQSLHDSPFGCDSMTPCPNPQIPPEPRPLQAFQGMPQAIASMSCTTKCLPSNQCGPSVMFCSPNNETFGGNGLNCGFPKFVLDSEYGNMSQMAFHQGMDDLYFLPPPCPCHFDIDFAEYDCFDFFWLEEVLGDCTNNTTDPNVNYYASRNLYEAVCELPTNAITHQQPPAPVAGHLGCLTLAQLNQITPPEGNVCTPPFFDANSVYDQGETNAAVVQAFPWDSYPETWLNKYFCVCQTGSNGIWKTYEANGIICDNQDINP